MMPEPFWYALGAILCMALGLLFAYRRLFELTVFGAVGAAALLVMALLTTRRVTMEDAFGKPLTTSSAKIGVVYDIVGGVDGRVTVSNLRTHLIVRERGSDPDDLRLFVYPGRPVSRAFTVERDGEGVPTARPAK